MGAELDDPISEAANAALNGKTQIRLLEAGCGSASHIKLKGTVYAVGIDISEEQLQKNTSVAEKILGDLQTYPLPHEAFDVVVCWMVLEHLPKPEAAVMNMFQATKPGGLVLLGFPHLVSFKGLVTKITPYWFHKAFYRVLKYKNRPFPTYLRAAILPKNLTRLAESNGFSVVKCHLVEGGQSRRLKKHFPPAKWALSLANGLVRVLSLGKLDMLLDNCGLVLKKNPIETANRDATAAASINV